MIEPQDWFAARGDDTLALDWPGTDENSVVWEIGGYEGRWALQMAEKYNPQLYVFEPQDWAAVKIEEKLEGYNAKIHQFGLWTHGGEMTLTEFGRDGGTLMSFPGGKDTRSILVVDAYSFFIKEHIDQIDVCLMNIEGGEFVLLPYMIGMGMMPKIKYFWCQWHLFVQTAAEKWLRLRQMLDVTHEMIWDCGSTAQAWKRRE
jgi:FkbM family methyltransferase